jgi:hypothetical protein
MMIISKIFTKIHKHDSITIIQDKPIKEFWERKMQAYVVRLVQLCQKEPVRMFARNLRDKYGYDNQTKAKKEKYNIGMRH